LEGHCTKIKVTPVLIVHKEEEKTQKKSGRLFASAEVIGLHLYGNLKLLLGLYKKYHLKTFNTGTHNSAQNDTFGAINY